MKVASILIVSLIGIVSHYGTEVAAQYDYGNALHASLLFYEAQRSGRLPGNKRINWRWDSMVNDGRDVGRDLSGGYFDAGDTVKFGFPMAYTITVLAWGGVDYRNAYERSGEFGNLLSAVRWGTDYFIKCHANDNEFYGQVGNGDQDHAVWGRPEDWENQRRPQRPSYKITAQGGGADLAGETAAALAAASILFRDVDGGYSQNLLRHAESLYRFATAHRVVYTRQLWAAQKFYGSSNFADELLWAAAWLLRATNNNHYRDEVNNHLRSYGYLAGRPGGFGWDDKTAGAQVLLAQITGEGRFRDMSKNFCDYMLYGVPKTPKGLVYINQWGTLRHATTAAFICLHVANKLNINKGAYQNFGMKQVGYALGDTGRSFVIGWGRNPPSRPHHRSSSCPWPPAACDYGQAYNNPGPNYHTLTGALVGGPDRNDQYVDSRGDYVRNEVAMDYNAGFTSALAAIIGRS